MEVQVLVNGHTTVKRRVSIRSTAIPGVGRAFPLLATLLFTNSRHHTDKVCQKVICPSFALHRLRLHRHHIHTTCQSPAVSPVSPSRSQKPHWVMAQFQPISSCQTTSSPRPPSPPSPPCLRSSGIRLNATSGCSTHPEKGQSQLAMPCRASRSLASMFAVNLQNTTSLGHTVSA